MDHCSVKHVAAIGGGALEHQADLGRTDQRRVWVPLDVEGPLVVRLPVALVAAEDTFKQRLDVTMIQYQVGVDVGAWADPLTSLSLTPGLEKPRQVVPGPQAVSIHVACNNLRGRRGLAEAQTGDQDRGGDQCLNKPPTRCFSSWTANVLLSAHLATLIRNPTSLREFD